MMFRKNLNELFGQPNTNTLKIFHTGLEKVSFNSLTKECLNYPKTALISHVSKVMLKIFQARLQQYVNQELPEVKAGFQRGKGTRDQIANVCWIME